MMVISWPSTLVSVCPGFDSFALLPHAHSDDASTSSTAAPSASGRFRLALE